MKWGSNLFLFLIAAGLFFSSNNFSKEAPGDDEYAAFAEIMPEPVNGIEGIYKKISYPAVAKKAGIEGKVYVMVFVNESGDVDDVKVIRGIGAGCEDEVIDVVKETKFKPASNKGVATKVKLSLAFTFKLK